MSKPFDIPKIGNANHYVKELMLKMADLKQSFWSIPAEDIFKRLKASKDGLSSMEEEKKLTAIGINPIKPQKIAVHLSFFIAT